MGDTTEAEEGRVEYHVGGLVPGKLEVPVWEEVRRSAPTTHRLEKAKTSGYRSTSLSQKDPGLCVRTSVWNLVEE